MKHFASRSALALAALAVGAMSATPALARDRHYGGWGHHHHRGGGIDGGDVLAGLLIVGGIAAIATAVSNDRDDRRAEPEPRSYPGGPDYGAEGDAVDDGRYADPRDESDGYGRQVPGGYRAQGGFDSAVDACSAELERGDRRIDSVDKVGRMGERFNVEGRLSDGRGYACSVDAQGQIRSVAVDGQAAF